MSIAAYRAVWTRSRARGATQHLLLAFADFAGEEGVAWPSVSTIADRLQINYENARKGIVNAVQAGELVRVGVGKRGVVVYRLACCDAGYVGRQPPSRTREVISATPLANEGGCDAATPLANEGGCPTDPPRFAPRPPSFATGDPPRQRGTNRKEPSVEEERNAAAATRDAVLMRAVDEWNRLAQSHDLVPVAHLTDARAQKLAARLDDAGGIEGWWAALLKIGSTPGLRGVGGGWRASFDWLLAEQNFTRVLEGHYDGWDSTRPPNGHGRAGKGSLDPLFDGIAQAVAVIEADDDG